MLGKHQVYNAVNAIETVKLLGVEDEFIKKGLAHTKFRGRLEIISQNPVIIQDGAHNYSGVVALYDALKTYFNDKNFAGYNRNLESIIPVEYCLNKSAYTSVLNR